MLLTREERQVVHNATARFTLSFFLFLYLMHFARTHLHNTSADSLRTQIADVDDVTVAAPKGELDPVDVLVKDEERISSEIKAELNLTLATSLA
jgi:hypothetical protein